MDNFGVKGAAIPSLLMELRKMRPFPEDVGGGAPKNFEGGSLLGLGAEYNYSTQGTEGGGEGGEDGDGGGETGMAANGKLPVGSLAAAVIYARNRTPASGAAAEQLQEILPEQEARLQPEMSDRSPVSRVLSDRLASLRRARRRLEMELGGTDGRGAMQANATAAANAHANANATATAVAVAAATASVTATSRAENTGTAKDDDTAQCASGAESGPTGMVGCPPVKIELPSTAAEPSRWEAERDETQVLDDGGSWAWVKESVQSLTKAMAVLDVASGVRGANVMRDSRDTVSSGEGSTAAAEKSYRSLEMSNIYAEADDFLSQSSYEMNSLWHGLLSGAHDDILDDEDDSESDQSHSGIDLVSRLEVGPGPSARSLFATDGNDDAPPISAARPRVQATVAQLATHQSFLPSLSHTTCSIRTCHSLSDADNEDIEVLAADEGDGRYKSQCTTNQGQSVVDCMHSDGVAEDLDDQRDRRIDALNSAVCAVRRDLAGIISLMGMRKSLDGESNISDVNQEWEDVHLVGRDLVNHSAHIEALSTSLAIIPPTLAESACSLEPLATSIAQFSIELQSLRPLDVNGTLVVHASPRERASVDFASMQSSILEEICDLDMQIAHIERVQSQLLLHDVSSSSLDNLKRGLHDESNLQHSGSDSVRPVGCNLAFSDLILVPAVGHASLEEMGAETSDLNLPGCAFVAPAWAAEAVDAACQVSQSLATRGDLSNEGTEQTEQMADAYGRCVVDAFTAQPHPLKKPRPHHELGGRDESNRYQTYVDRNKDARASLVANLHAKETCFATADQMQQGSSGQDFSDLNSLLEERVELVAEMERLCSLLPSHTAFGAWSSGNVAPSASLAKQPQHYPPSQVAPKGAVVTRKFCSSAERAALAARLAGHTSDASSTAERPGQQLAATAVESSVHWTVNQAGSAATMPAENDRVESTASAEDGWEGCADRVVKSCELHEALDKLCQGLSDLHFLKEIIIPGASMPQEAQRLDIRMGVTRTQAPSQASPVRVLDLSGMEDEDDLLDRLRKLGKSQQPVSELDLSGCPAGPGSKMHEASRGAHSSP